MTPLEIKVYFEAKRQSYEEKNFFCYLQSVYFHDAIAVNLHNVLSKGKKAEFHKEPIRLMPLTEQEKAEHEEKELQKLISYLDNFQKDFNKKEAAI